MNWLLTYLEKLRERPEAYRKKVALGITTFLILVIIGAWVPWFLASVNAAPKYKGPSIVSIFKSFGHEVSQVFNQPSRPAAAVSNALSDAPADVSTTTPASAQQAGEPVLQP